jgi:L-seryl-tRNA(Ser) seleniumtransferase
VQFALNAQLGELALRADSMLRLLQYAGIEAAIVQSHAAVGGGGAPGVDLPSVAVSLPERYAAPLRTGRVPVVGRIERGRCLLDLRTVPPGQDDELVAAVVACT